MSNISREPGLVLRTAGYLFIFCAAVLLFAQPVAATPRMQGGDEIALVYGETVDGQLSVDRPSTFYWFEGHTGDSITITMIATGGGIDPFVVLNTEDRTPLAVDDNGGGAKNARLNFVIPQDGRYIIQATHAGGIVPIEGGTFSLNLTAVVDTAGPTPGIASEGPSPGSQAGQIKQLVHVTSDTSIQGTLTRQSPTQFFWFEAQGGDQLVVTPDQMTDFHPLLALYDSRFDEVDRAASGAGLRVSLPNDGIYFLAVALPEQAGFGGNFLIDLDLGTNPAREGNYIDVQYGDMLSGNIDDAVPAVTYRFYGRGGDVVTLTMSRAGGDLNSYLYLLDGDGQLLYEDNDSGANDTDALILYTLPVDGPYLVTATRLGQAQGTTSGSFVFEIQSTSSPAGIEADSEPSLPDDYADLPEIVYGETVEGEISNGKFMDVYVFKGTEGDVISIDMVSVNPDSPAALDPFLVLLDDQRIPLAERDDIVDGVQRDAHLEFTLPRTAYYGIVATRFDHERGTTTGAYALTLNGPTDAIATPDATQRSTSSLDQLVATPLIPGSPVQATFDKAAHLYSFTAFAGSLVDIAVTTDPGLDSLVVLADEDLREIQSSITGALTNITISETGKYLVMVAPRLGPAYQQDGGYILALNLTSETTTEPSTAARQLVYGDVVNGVIDDSTTSQIYTFAGAEGQRIRIVMEATPGSSLDSYLELQNADGVVIDANDDIDPGIVRDSQIIADLPADDTYVIIASRYVGPDTEPTSGTYQLKLELLDDYAVPGVSSTTTPLSYGQTATGEINDNQYILFYVFDGSAGDIVTIRVENLSGNLDTVLHLYQSSGSDWVEIASNDDSPTGGTYEPLLSNVILPQTGKYLIAVNRYGLDRESTLGTFRISLVKEP